MSRTKLCSLAKRLRSDVGVSFEAGGASGKDNTDTYSKMLQVLFGVTPAMANGVISAFPTLKQLRQACLMIESEEEAKRQLSDLNITRGDMVLDGGVSSRRLGPVMAARIWTNVRHPEPSLTFR